MLFTLDQEGDGFIDAIARLDIRHEENVGFSGNGVDDVFMSGGFLIHCIVEGQGTVKETPLDLPRWFIPVSSAASRVGAWPD